ncbi:hypothetical protein [Actinomadura atramentaria]|uniref:hypothetical protein n=1 Tax=Actinomadura atramentaria TaxID=1990 RepID=UPI00037102A2|nr:hypothetical protein [Actinomadura atramentaria]
MSTTSPSPGEKIAAALRRTPVYVDASLASALPAADRRRLVAAMAKAPVPVFAVIVPIVAGGTWSDGDQLLTVVHDRLGRDGVYVGFGKTSDTIVAREWRGGRSEKYGSPHSALEAAWAVNFDRKMDDASLYTRLTRFTDLIVSGKGKAEYDRLSDEIEARAKEREKRTGGAPGGGGRGGSNGALLGTVGGAAGVAVAAVAAALVWRRRRTAAAARRPGDGLLLPRAVFANAGKATEDELRAQAAREVVAFGEALDAADVATDDDRPRALVGRALDAYQAAGKALDAAAGVPDLAGVLVLVDQGRDALASAAALGAGRAELPPSPLCFFHPLHGDGSERVDWRPLGTRRRLRVACCPACAKAVRERRSPDWLLDDRDGRPVPYFEVPGERSVWAETGYGQFREDLVERVLRGDLDR